MKKSQNSILRFSSRLFSVLLVFMLVGVVFVPAVAAENVKLTTEKYSIGLISSSETTKELMVYSDAEKTKPLYFVSSEKVVMDDKQVNSLKMYAVNADGTIDYSRSIIKDSYFEYDAEEGLHIHIGSVDMSNIISGTSMSLGVLGAIIGAAIGSLFSDDTSSIIAAGLTAAIGTFILGGVINYTNADNSLDIYIDTITLAYLAAIIALPGNQPATIRLGTTDVVILL